MLFVQFSLQGSRSGWSAEEDSHNCSCCSKCRKKMSRLTLENALLKHSSPELPTWKSNSILSLCIFQIDPLMYTLLLPWMQTRLTLENSFPTPAHVPTQKNQQHSQSIHYYFKLISCIYTSYATVISVHCLMQQMIIIIIISPPPFVMHSSSYSHLYSPLY